MDTNGAQEVKKTNVCMLELVVQIEGTFARTPLFKLGNTNNELTNYCTTYHLDGSIKSLLVTSCQNFSGGSKQKINISCQLFGNIYICRRESEDDSEVGGKEPISTIVCCLVLKKTAIEQAYLLHCQEATPVHFEER